MDDDRGARAHPLGFAAHVERCRGVCASSSPWPSWSPRAARSWRPSSDTEPLWIGAPRALGLGLGVLLLGMLAVFLVARRKPSVLHAAR
ncbi:MAG: hypothetical protein R3B99_35325 [Polyangiales bacterium]